MNFGSNAAVSTGIVQHYDITAEIVVTYIPVSLVTAVIDVLATGYENPCLAVTRGGEIDARRPFYNVTLDNSLLTPDQFQNGSLTSLYLAIPAPITAANAQYLTLPSDGSPPEFDKLLTAAQFEGALTSYYATPNATADRLALRLRGGK